MFWNILSIENTKNLKRSMLWIEMAAFFVLVITFFGILFLTLNLDLGGEAGTAEARAQLEESLTWPGALISVFSLASGNNLGGLLLVLFVGAVIAQEYSWRTMNLWLSRGTPRPALILGKFAGLLLPVLMIVLSALLGVVLISSLLTFHLQGSLPFDQVNFFQLVLSVLRSAYALLPYAGLAFFLGVATRSVAAAVGGSLAFSLLAEGLLLQLFSFFNHSFGKIAAYLPAGLASSLTSLNQAIAADAGSLNAAAAAQGPSPLIAAFGIAAWTLLFVGLAVGVFRRQDLSA